MLFVVLRSIAFFVILRAEFMLSLPKELVLSLPKGPQNDEEKAGGLTGLKKGVILKEVLCVCGKKEKRLLILTDVGLFSFFFKNLRVS